MRLDLTTLLVREYDEAVAFFVEALGFALVEDTPDTDQPDKRWVVVRPPDGGDGGGAGLLLARAVGDDQVSAVGRQAGGRVGFFLHVDDFASTYTRMRAAGVRFEEEPRHEVYGTVVVFRDVAGNLWDLLGTPTGRPAERPAE